MNILFSGFHEIFALPHFCFLKWGHPTGMLREGRRGSMHKRTSPKVFGHAKQLRRNQTEAEAKLWSRLRNHQLKDVGFRRQHAIGNYVVDFCAPRRKLIIELDGSQHLEQEDYDAARTAFLESQGYRVLRFWNNEVMKDIQGVIRAIEFAL
jgi:very-short-patch-repair endonuclease